MKSFFEKHGLILVISLLLLGVFIIGQVLSNYVILERAEEIYVDEEKYYDSVELVSIEYNFDVDTLGLNTYIAEFTYEGNTFEVYLDNEFSYTETISGGSIESMVYSAVKQHAENEELLQNTAYLVSYDETTKTLVMTANGYKGKGSISVEFILNDSLEIDAYTVTSTETYTNEYNDSYTGGAVPAVENTIINSYIADENYTADSVAGASAGTATAMDELLALLDLFLDSMEGGN